MNRLALAELAAPLRFHWMLPEAGAAAVRTPPEAARFRLEKTRPHSPASTPDLPGWEHFARAAEESGVESVLISFGRFEPDPILISGALGRVVEKLKFIVAHRSGLAQPAALVQQLNTLSTLLGGRVALNLVAGSATAEQHAYGDFLAHDERYARAEEFLAVCRSFWQPAAAPVHFQGRFYCVDGGYFPTAFAARGGPEIYISGHSPAAERLARAQGGCWLRCAEAPEALAPIVARSRAAGLEVGLRLCLLSRETREEALAVAQALIPACESGLRDSRREPRADSTMYRDSTRAGAAWLTPSLWAGLVPLCGPVWTTLLGTPEEIAESLLAYRRIGVSQFILSGWPEIDEVRRFGRDVLPLVRELERRRPTTPRRPNLCTLNPPRHDR